MNDAGAPVFRPSRRAALKLAGGLGVLGLAAACTSDTPTQPTTSAGSSTALSTSPAASAPASAPASSTTPPSSPAAPSTPAAPPWAALSATLRRPLVRTGSPALAAAARLYNPRFDSLAAPAAVAQVGSAAEVAACVQFAARSHVPIALRAGGHSYGGWSTGRGLVVDTRGLASVQVDPAVRLARIGAGATLVDVYTALAAKNVAIAGGSCPTVGLTGLALGGGVGVLTRAFGLTCDAIRSVQIVTADGRLRTVDATHDPDLFWALRGGGGGSFGAVTELTLAVRPAPTVLMFFLEFAFDQAASVVAAWQQWVPGTPASLWSTCKLLGDPGDGSLHATVSGTWIGSASQLDGQLGSLLGRLPAPTARSVQTRDYGSAMLAEAGCYGQSPQQCTVDALSAPKRQPFAATSSIAYSPIPAAGIAAAVAHTRQALDVRGLVEGGVSFDALGGAVAAVAPKATAYPHRLALASVQYTATWGATAPAGPSAAAPYDAYVRGFRGAMAPWLGASAYANYADASIADYGTAYWGANYPRLQQVKARYDPDNLFTFAQAVKA